VGWGRGEIVKMGEEMGGGNGVGGRAREGREVAVGESMGGRGKREAQGGGSVWRVWGELEEGWW